MAARHAASGILRAGAEIVVDADLQQVGLHVGDLVGHLARRIGGVAVITGPATNTRARSVAAAFSARSSKPAA
jgi:hypothetical protein